MNNILKIGFIGLLATITHASEVDYGKGTFEMSGGFVGLDKAISADISTYSMVEQHKNIGSSNWFYKYNFTWYDSDQMVQGQSSTNNVGSAVSVDLTTQPTIDYRLQGLDLNLVLGKDLIHSDENNYFAAGIMLGISIPWIDSKDDDDNDDSSDDDSDSMEDSKTTIYTYKVGPSITVRKSLNSFFTIYGSGTYAYQTGTMKNDYADSDLTVNGTFQEYDFGIRFQPVSEDYEFDWITISPRLYATLGYRYTSWDLDDINIDVTGTGRSFTQMDFNMNSKVTYFGLGYSF